MPSQPLTPETTLGAQSPGSQPEDASPALLGHAGHPSGLAIIGSKISPAVEDRRVLTRARLVGWLDQQRHARVCLLTAEAGYGKSTLLSDFARRSDQTCVWYRLESSDGDWITFLSYMVAALRDVLPGFGRSTEALLRNVAAMGPSRELVLAQFLADLSAADGIEMIVILDDYHLVSESADIRMIVSRLIERAPVGMRFVLAGRRRPSLALGRLAAQGQVVELSTSDLRFTRPEIEEFFALAYGQPLDQHACDVVAERTQGWAASLQLVAASLAVSRPSEVGAFIEALSGATGPIYDFLAEEVLARMSPVTHRVLLHASLVDRVSPSLVTAAMSVSDEPVSMDTVTVHLEDARTLGLLGSAEVGSGGARIHPLFREFLQQQFAESTPPDQVKRMHLVIAQAAEDDAWLVAAKHYALAGAEQDAMRVIGSAASEALGTGAWGAAVEVVALMPDATPPPAVDVIKARALTAEGRPDEALLCLDALDPGVMNAVERSLASLARASALQMAGRSQQLWEEVALLGSQEHGDAIVNRLAKSWGLMRVACHGGSIGAARRSLNLLSREAARAGLSHYAGIALHNSATAALAQGAYAEAARLAAESRDVLERSPSDATIRHSSLATLAVAEAEMGNLARSERLARDAVSALDAHPDALADAAYLAAVVGDIQRAESIEQRLRRLIAGGLIEVGARHQAAVARTTRLVAEGDYQGAYRSAVDLDDGRCDELDGLARTAYLKALAAALVEAPSASTDISEALVRVEAQQAWRWEFRLRLLEAAAQQDGSGLARWIGDCLEHSPLAIAELANVIGGALHLSEAIPTAIRQAVGQSPARWRPVLVRQLLDDRPSAEAAARLLAEHGTHDDAAHVAAYERRASRHGRRTYLARALVRRVTPTLRIHDLGRTTYEIAGVEAEVSASRKKPLALVLYLVTRSSQVGVREQVLEALWPDQSPAAAMNSLHQTLHFVRKDLAPWRGDGPTAEYVRLDGDLVYIDPELVQVDSVAFIRQSTQALNAPAISRVGPSVLQLYAGRFAPEFEYEDWAEDWRTLVHGQYLRLSQATAMALLRDDMPQSAIDVLSRSIAIDPLAFDLRALLIRSLAEVGAADAAADHYRQHSNLLKRELGLRAPPYEALIRGQT